MSSFTVLKKQASSRFSAICLVSIGIAAFLIRLYYLPTQVPLSYDAFYYFMYSVDINYLAHLPKDWSPINNGWPSFVSLFFSFFHFGDMLSYMQIQRLLSIIISVFTIIPIYFLCKRFVERNIAFLGVAIFAFDPRIVLNSILGITEPLYILLGAIALVLFLNPDKKIMYTSFGLAALATLIRGEGLFFFATLTILFFVRYRKDRLVVSKYLLALAIFVLIITPMSLYRIEVTGSDGIFIRTSSGILNLSQTVSDPEGPGLLLLGDTFSIFFKYVGWVMIPNFIFFVPVGAYLILRNRNFEKNAIIISTGIMSIPALAAYTFPALDTRYLYFLFPMLCILAVLATKRYTQKFSNKKIIVFLIVTGILGSSLTFYEYKKIDYNHEQESFEIAKKIATTAGGVNSYYPEHGYLRPAVMSLNWPTSHSIKPINFTIISTEGFDSLPQYIMESKDKGLTHLVVDDSENREPFLTDVFYHQEEYPYLIEEFDSQDHKYNYRLKIYKINYSKFDSIYKPTS